MTILKTKSGKEIDTTEFDGKPYGAFTNYVRQNIDAKWGNSEEVDSGPGKYSVTFKAIKTVPCYTTLEIEADTVEEAREKGLKEVYRQQNSLDWDDGVDEDIAEIEVDEVEEVDKEQEED